MGADWVNIELGELCEIKMGQSPPSSTYNTIGEGIPFFQGKAEFTDLYPKVTKWCTAPKKKAKKNDILLSVRAPVGSTNIANIDCAIGRGLAAISFPFGNKYLWFFLNLIEKRLDKQGTGTTFRAISGNILKSQKIPLPPLPEQRAIVAKIDQLFSELDNGIENLKKAQEQLKVYRQAVLKKAFEGELTKEWREKNDAISSFEFLSRIADDRSKNPFEKKSIYHKKISHDFDFKRDDKISTWSKGTLDKLVYIAARIGWRGLKKSEYTEKGPLFLSVHSLNHGKYVDYYEAYHLSEERYEESPEIQLQEGDVLLCKDGAGIGKLGIVKHLPERATVNSSILVIRGLEILDQEFLYYLFSGPSLQSIVFERITGSATPHLFQKDIRKFKLLIPPKEEQKQIVQEIESRLSVCDNVEQSIKENLNKAKALRQSILKKAFEGKLLTKKELKQCRQQPDWEPAKKLLERIKDEKNETRSN